MRRRAAHPRAPLRRSTAHPSSFGTTVLAAPPNAVYALNGWSFRDSTVSPLLYHDLTVLERSLLSLSRLEPVTPRSSSHTPRSLADTPRTSASVGSVRSQRYKVLEALGAPQAGSAGRRVGRVERERCNRGNG